MQVPKPSAQSQTLRAGLLAGAALSLTAGQALAQEVARFGDPAQLEEVIVTAQKRAEDQQKAPLSITVLSGEDLRAQNRQRVDEIVQNVPGVQVQEGPVGPQFIVRGVSNNLAPTSPSPTAIYIDDVYSDRQDVSRTAFFDIAQAEILRGPQGTLFGGNAVGGAIRINTNDPKSDYEAFGQVGVGSYNLLQAQGMVNIPVSSSLAVRAAFFSENRDGYLSNGQDDSVIQSGRVKLRFAPSDALVVTSAVDYGLLRGQGPGAIPSPYPKAVDSLSDPWRTTAGVNNVKESTLLSVRNEVNLILGGFNLVWIPAYYQDYYHTNFENVSSRQIQDQRKSQHSEEVRLSSVTDSALRWVAGAFYLKSNQPLTTLSNGILSTTAFDRNRATGLFGQATLSLSERLRVTGGLRYSQEKKTSSFQETTNGVANRPLAIYAKTFDAWTWKAGAEWDLSERSMAYATASTGFRAGSVGALTVDPETLHAYQFGSKNRFLGNRLQINGEAFYYKYGNYQLSYFDTTVFQVKLFNAKGVVVYGGEVEASYQLTANDRVDLSVAYLKGALGDSTIIPGPSGGDYSSYDLNHTPAWSMNLGYERKWVLPNEATLTASGKVHYQTGSWVNFQHGLGSRQPAYAMTDLFASYSPADARWTFSAYVKNLEDYPVVTYWSKGGGPGAPNIAYLAAPRTYGVSLSAKF